MAGHVIVKKREKPATPKSLLEGVTLFKWDDSDNNPKKYTFKVDKEGFFLFARGEDSSQSALVWDLVLLSDVRSYKLAKDSKVADTLTSFVEGELNESQCMTLVYRQDGITKLTLTHLMALTPQAAADFKTSINQLAHHQSDFNISVAVGLKKHYVRILLEANGNGQLLIKNIQKLMMVTKGSNVIDNYLETAKTAVKDSKDGTYVEISEFTEDIYCNLVDTLLQNRGPDLDVLKQAANIKARKQYVNGKEFMAFLNTHQRDPRLNTILYPLVTSEQAKGLMTKYGKDSDRLTMKDLLIYLMNEENMVLDPGVFDQYQDMGRPLNHYFINSSHNTYLNGHQLRSESLAEMYIQILLTGCRCVELDCWPRSDFEDIVITHGNTWCTKITFKEVVEAINEYAFVASDYPVILSIENHCNKYPKLIARMASIFVEVFGDKLLSEPFEDFPLDSGVALPSPERLKGKILIKDKIRNAKGGQDNTATLQRGTTLQGVQENEELEIESTDVVQDKKENVEKPVITEETAKENSVQPKKIPPPLLTRPSLMKGMTILEEPLSLEDKQKPPPRKSSIPLTPEKRNSVTSTTSSGSKIQKNASVDSTGSGDEKPKYESGEASVSGPLNELLNYTTALSFESFEACEKLNCCYIMSSFHEEKGLNFIKTKPKDFVRYNIRQNSRVYPAGTRIASSNYMPQIYWNVGCQMVALNFQTSDMPMQVNYAKFEINGGTGYLLKPSVLRLERGFNPFIQKKLEDIVPARLSVKIISGMFITKKRTNLVVELEMYGLPADLVRKQFTKKRAPAPHPFWDEDYFVFKRVLLPELALLRLAVFDDDHIMVGQRIFPMELLRAGFRHISLRDKHNNPLGMANLFVHIKIEDYVPDEYEEFVAALENPMMFASRALEQMTMGTKENEEDEFPDSGDPVTNKSPDPPRVSSVPVMVVTDDSKSNPSAKPRKDSAPPELIVQDTSAISKAPRPSTDLGLGVKTFPRSPSFGGDSSLPSLLEAKSRPKFPAAQHTDTTIIEHPDYLKLLKRYSKGRADMVKKHEKALNSLKLKQEKESKKSSNKSKEMEEAHKEALSKLEVAHKNELREYDRHSKIEQNDKQKFLLDVTHKTQRKFLDKAQKTDVSKVQVEIAQELRQMKRNETQSKNKDVLRGIEQELFRMGMQTRSELDSLHKKEDAYFKQTMEEALKIMNEQHQKEIEELTTPDDSTL